MNRTNNTEDILEAIRDMMGEKNADHQNELPKDVLELTKPLKDNFSKLFLESIIIPNPLSSVAITKLPVLLTRYELVPP